MNKEEIVKLIKYVTGSMAAVLLAEAMGLAFAYSAGIITLLTIQDTKKETVKIAGKRILLFWIMTVLSVIIFPLVDFHVWAFGLVMIPCLYCGMAFHMKEAMVSAAELPKSREEFESRAMLYHILEDMRVFLVYARFIPTD